MLSFGERFGTVLDSLDTTAYKFAGQHSLNRSSMFNMLNGRTKPNLDMLERLCNIEPRISAEFLLRGEGEPLRDVERSTNQSTVEELKTVKQAIEKRIQELGGQID